jgi:hypothetical protein
MSLILSNFYLVVVAVIVIVRLFLLLRRWVERRAARNNRTPPPLAGIEDIEAEGAALLEDDDFSAWSLPVVDTPETVPPAKVPQVQAPPVHDSPIRISPEPVPPHLLWQPVTGVQPRPREEPQAPVPRLPLALAGEDPPKTTGAGGVFWEKLRDLPPMTQGIIFSEILGPPKGLRSFRK